jgi:hypothetical protein
MNTGKEYENLTSGVFRTLSKSERYTNVVRDAKLEGPDGKRQIDVLVETEIFGHNTKTMIECRDYSRPLDIEHIDALDSKSADLAVDMVVLVARNGFTKKAKHKAKRKNIRLATLDKVDVTELGIDMRLGVVEIFPTRISFQFINDSGSKFNWSYQSTKFNGLTLLNFVKTGLESCKFGVKPTCEPIIWPDTTGELVLSNDEGIEISDVQIVIEYELSMYMGLLSNLKDTVLYKNLSEAKSHLIYLLSELREYQDRFNLFTPDETVTLAAGEHMRIHTLVPDVFFSSFGAKIYNKDGTIEKKGAQETMEGFDEILAPPSVAESEDSNEKT